MDNLTNNLLNIVEKSWSALAADRFSCEVALSGGVDSVVLLHLLKRLRDKQPNFELSAMHIHHGLQAVANEWVIFCQNLCDKWQIPLTIQKVKVNSNPLKRSKYYRQKMRCINTPDNHNYKDRLSKNVCF